VAERVVSPAHGVGDLAADPFLPLETRINVRGNVGRRTSSERWARTSGWCAGAPTSRAAAPVRVGHGSSSSLPNGTWAAVQLDSHGAVVAQTRNHPTRTAAREAIEAALRSAAVQS